MNRLHQLTEPQEIERQFTEIVNKAINEHMENTARTVCLPKHPSDQFIEVVAIKPSIDRIRLDYSINQADTKGCVAS